MEIKEFQELSTRTMNESLSFNEKVANMIFGINGEAGEVTDILKNIYTIIMNWIWIISKKKLEMLCFI